MGFIFDNLAFAWNDALSFAREQLSTNDPLTWFLIAFPLFVFAELPRYLVPALTVPLLRLFGLPREDPDAERAFLATRPKISILLVGLNEAATVGRAIDTLLDLGYEGLDIVVVDDGSTDGMSLIAQPYADRGQIRLFRNSAASGRGGKPAAINLALHAARGDFLLVLDSDTTFDRDILVHMVGPFRDPSVGAVAGNVKVRNAEAGLITALQALEYQVSIGMWKRWLDLFGMNYLASGAMGAFRRTAVESVGAWDQELAEDADISIKIKKAGWRLVFAPRAVGLTNAPTEWKRLVLQRIRWDKGMLRTFFRKHLDFLNPRRFDPRGAIELSLEFFFAVVCTYLQIGYLVFMAVYSPALLGFAMVVTFGANAVLSLLAQTAAWTMSERRRDEAWLLCLAPLLPLHRTVLMLARAYGLTLELLRLHYDETFLPQTAWRNTRKW